MRFIDSTMISDTSESINDARSFLGNSLYRLAPVGSRVTCNPAPVGTDEDWLFLVKPQKLDTFGFVIEDEVADKLQALGFTQDGSPEFYTGCDAGGFRSWRRGDVNIVTTADPIFFDLFISATELAKRFNLLDKEDRIALFQLVLYGVSPHNLVQKYHPPIGPAPRFTEPMVEDVELEIR